MRPADARLERVLGEGAATFRATFDLVPDPVGVLWAIRDDEGALVDFETGYANPAMDRMIGVPLEVSLGHRLLEDAPDFGNDEAYRRMRGVLETGRPAVVETTVDGGEGPFGRVRGVYLHRALPFGADGVLNLVSDVTEERRLQSELEEYAKVAAHDLREPLTTMTLFVEQLARRVDSGGDADTERLIELMRRTLGRARTLVDGILEYARSGATPDPEPLDMGGLVAEVLDSFAAALRDTDAEVTVGPLPTVRGDPRLFGRVFQNLIANSLKFRSATRPRVTIAAEHADGVWLFSVQDNGVGLPAGAGEDIFGMFKRAHGDDFSGCGIGLAVCRKVVEAHGGAIWAEPAEGTGTVVRFTVPATGSRTEVR